MGSVRVGGREVGDGAPCWVVAELGQNHNGDVGLALRMIDAAKAAGADAVKFQKREVDLAVPDAQRGALRSTPWGVMSYLNYRHRLELGRDDYDAIDAHCRSVGIPWFASVWDEASLEFLVGRYRLPAIKVPSACLTDLPLLQHCRATGRPIVMSTGMSTLDEIERACHVLGTPGTQDRLGDIMISAAPLLLMHCRSTYPAAYPELNLLAIRSLRELYGVPVGYSGHEVGLWTTLCAVALGACAVERHFTLDRAMWGTDQAASVEPRGLEQLVRQIRHFEQARGDGRIGPTESEAPVRARLRRIT